MVTVQQFKAKFIFRSRQFPKVKQLHSVKWENKPVDGV